MVRNYWLNIVVLINWIVYKERKMKKLILSIICVPLLLVATTAFAGIEGSLHDIYNRTNDAGNTNEQICVYCHTPHAANIDFTGAPIWNKPTPTDTAFQMYGTTIAGTTTDATPAASSLACLTCHDGASAINSVVNAPGSGLGSGSLGTPAYLGGVYAIGGKGSGNDGAGLTNDHPVSIEYNEGRASLKPLNTVITGWGSFTTIQQLLRGPAQDRVECGSCHDPHITDNGSFLRASNVASAVCLTCHDK